MINKIIKIFESDNFQNVIVPLSLDIKEVIYLSRHDIDNIDKDICINILKKYKDIKVNFYKVDEDNEEKYLDKDSVLDIGASKYLTLRLTELAFKNNLKIIYLDEEEKKIKEYKSHGILCDKLFKLKIEDIINLGHGRIIDHMHKPSTNVETKKLIYNVINTNNDYSSFISFINNVNQIISNQNNDGDTYYLNEAGVNRIKSFNNYKLYSSYNLFTLQDNKLTFFNGDIKRIFSASGALLEEYIYNKLLDSKLFDDVLMSIKIEFNNKRYRSPITCELDGLVLKDNTLLFVSAKSNKVETADLNEIKVHNTRFGNQYSKPVICVNKDLNVVSPSIYAKAEELDVYVIDEPYYKLDKIAEKFLSIVDGTYKYDKI